MPTLFLLLICFLTLKFYHTYKKLSVQFSHSVVYNSVTPWTTALPCSSPTPRAYSNSCPSCQWCHPTISSCVIPFSSCLQSFPALGSFSNESALHIRWPKYWSFSFGLSFSNEYSGLISSRMDKSSPWNPLVKKCWTLQGAFCYRIWDGNAFMVLKYKQLPWNGHELFLLNQGKVYKKW